MPRLPLVACSSALAVLAALALPTLGMAADDSATAPAPTAAPSATAVSVAGDNAAEDAIGSGTPVIASIRGNSAVVRFGPNKDALPACTLRSGDTVEILGRAQVPNWYVVRMPATGKAWVSAKVLSPLDGGKRWQVRKDGAHARADATPGAAIICDLPIGTVLQDQGGAVKGDFHAVYIPTAIAYIHQSRVNLPGADAVALQRLDASAADANWQAALTDYAALREQARGNPAAALTIQWDPLLKRLAAVAKQHPDAAVRLSALRAHDAITAVVAASVGVTIPGGILPPLAGEIPGTAAATAVATTGTGAAPTASSTAAVVTTTGDLPALPQPVPEAPQTHLAEGYVVTNTEYPKVGAAYLLQDGNSDIVAFLTVKDGSDVDLTQYNWMAVAVDGSATPVDPAAYAGKSVPVITVERVVLTHK
jgi:SH3-like domain-containing protein